MALIRRAVLSLLMGLVLLPLTALAASDTAPMKLTLEIKGPGHATYELLVGHGPFSLDVERAADQAGIDLDGVISVDAKTGEVELMYNLGVLWLGKAEGDKRSLRSSGRPIWPLGKSFALVSTPDVTAKVTLADSK